MNVDTAAQEVVTKTPPQVPVLLIVAIIAVVIIGVAVFLFIKRAPKKPFDLLQTRQKTLDTLDTPALVAWAREAPLEPGAERIVAYASRKWITKLGYQMPPELDVDHNVVAFVANKVTGDVARECLFSFSEMSDRVKKLFGETDCFILKD